MNMLTTHPQVIVLAPPTTDERRVWEYQLMLRPNEFGCKPRQRDAWRAVSAQALTRIHLRLRNTLLLKQISLRISKTNLMMRSVFL